LLQTPPSSSLIINLNLTPPPLRHLDLFQTNPISPNSTLSPKPNFHFPFHFPSSLLLSQLPSPTISVSLQIYHNLPPIFHNPFSPNRLHTLPIQSHLSKFSIILPCCSISTHVQFCPYLSQAFTFFPKLSLCFPICHFLFQSANFFSNLSLSPPPFDLPITKLLAYLEHYC